MGGRAERADAHVGGAAGVLRRDARRAAALGEQAPDITGVGDLRDAISQLAGDVTIEDNLIAEVLWTPEDDNDTMDREDMFMNFPELVSV